MRSHFPVLRRLRGRLALGVVGALALLAVPRDALAVNWADYWLPPNFFKTTEPIDVLFDFILWMTVIIGIAVFIAELIFLVRYRYRKDRHAKFIHGNGRLEMVWTLIPTLILALTAAVSQATWSAAKQPQHWPTTQEVLSGEKIEMRVVAHQFNWVFSTPARTASWARFVPSW